MPLLKGFEHTDGFHFTQITNKNPQFTFKKLQFSIFARFSLHLRNSVDEVFLFNWLNWAFAMHVFAKIFIQRKN